jgi:hypothetical protein
VDPANTHFTVVDRTLMNFTRTSVIYSFAQDSDFALGSTVEQLGAFSFAWSGINTFTVVEPSRLRVIARSAFLSCPHFVSIVIPSTVEVIEQCAFQHCLALREVVFAAGSRLRLIEAEAFSDCYCLQPVRVQRSAKICGLFAVVAEVSDTDGSQQIQVQFLRPRMRLWSPYSPLVKAGCI